MSLNDISDALNEILSTLNIGSAAPTLPVGYTRSDSVEIPPPDVALKIINTYKATLTKKIPKGERHSEFVKYAGTLYACGCEHDFIISELVRFDKEQMESPKNDISEITKIVDWICQKPQGIHKRIQTPIVVPQRPQAQPIIVTHQTATPPPYIWNSVSANGNVTLKIDSPTYAHFLKNHFSVVYFNKTIYLYDHGQHIYRQHINEMNTHIFNTYETWGISGKYKELVSEILAMVTAIDCNTEYPFNQSSDKIPVENGIIKIDYTNGGVTLLPHSPDHKFTYKLSVEYNPSLRNCNAISLLKRMVERGDIKTLLQIPAQALLQMQTGHSYKKAYLLQGEPHAGKTSYLKLLYELFGSDFRGTVSLQQLCDDRFVGGALEGKLLNIYDDLEDVALSVIDHFKNLTGDCNHAIERKYESRYTGKITAVHVFTCNYPPGFPDKVRRDAAFWTRWEYLKFPFSYPVNPNFYVEWYTPERKSAFLNLIISTMIYIRQKGLVSNSDIQGVMQSWNINSEPIYDFVAGIFDPNTTPNYTSHFSKQKLYKAYHDWCNENGIPEHKRKITMAAFSIALQAQNITPSQKKENKKIYETYATTHYIKKAGCVIDLNYTTGLF